MRLHPSITTSLRSVSRRKINSTIHIHFNSNLIQFTHLKHKIHSTVFHSQSITHSRHSIAHNASAVSRSAAARAASAAAAAAPPNIFWRLPSRLICVEAQFPGALRKATPALAVCTKVRAQYRMCMLTIGMSVRAGSVT